MVEDGGTIYFEPGTYYVNLEIGTVNPVNKSFALVGAGEGATILYSYSQDEIITDIGQGTHVTTIKGFTMMNESGAIFTNGTSPVITNCTFTGNSAQTGCAVFNTGNSAPIITNCILWNDASIEIYNDSSATTIVSYSDVQGDYAGVGNIDAKPLFKNRPSDLSLQGGSPCIDAGADASAFAYGSVNDDIRGVPRPQGSGHDMGAYEFLQSPWSPVSIMPLMRTQLANVVNEWNEIVETLPEEPTDGMAVLIERIQTHMQNVSQFTNPVYALGELSKALALMEELAMLLE